MEITFSLCSDAFLSVMLPPHAYFIDNIKNSRSFCELICLHLVHLYLYHLFCLLYV